MINAAKAGSSKYQIGEGKNLFDWTYVENVAYSHVLAGNKLFEDKKLGGEAFFITNDEPIPFWDMPKYCYSNLGFPTPKIIIPFWLAWYLAILIDFIVWLIAPIKKLNPTFTWLKVAVAGSYRHYNITKAKTKLGYKPPVPLQEAMKRTLDYYKIQLNKT